MKERVNVFARIKGRKSWILLGTIIKNPEETLTYKLGIGKTDDLGKAVETYFAQGKPYNKV